VNGLLLDPKLYTGNSQGSEILIAPGADADYNVQMLPFDNCDPNKSGECDNGQAGIRNSQGMYGDDDLQCKTRYLSYRDQRARKTSKSLLKIFH
jgi:hypothetical protein